MKTQPIIVALALALLSGCTTLTTEQKVDQLASLANVVAYTGTALHLEDNEQDLPAFKVVVAALDAMAEDDAYQPANLYAALEDLPVAALKDGDKGQIIIAGAVMLFDQAANQFIKPMTPETVKAVATGIRNGISLAIARFERGSG